MVEFVKDKPTPSAVNRYGIVDFYKDVINYANALSQTPRLGHFIPCDENDVPLEKPKNYESWLRKKLNTPYDADLSKYEKYQQACDRVLFEGCKYDSERKAVVCNAKYIFYVNYNITYEDLIKRNLPLTKVGAKFFGYANN